MRIIGVTSALIAMALASTGCLSSSHRIPKGELLKLSSTAPEQRGERVRVIQNLGGSEEPPPAGRVRGSTVVVVHQPIWIDGRPHRHDYESQPAAGNTVDHRPPTGSESGPAKSSGKTTKPGAASGKKADAKAWFVLAAIAAGALAVTEGARYDGWVQLHPMHPVHLYGRYGGYTVLPLAHIDQRTAAWAERAYVRETEGPWRTLGRAPLNRRGWTYGLFFGSGEVPVEDIDPEPGFLGHIQFGYFPTKQVGLQLDIAMGWTEDQFANTIYNSRTSLEVQGYLAKAGPVHAGLFGQLGTAFSLDDGLAAEDESLLYGGGALLQLELTTRLALTGRVGVTRSFGEYANELGVGISIY